MNTITIHAPTCDEAEARVRGILADVLLLGHRHPDLARPAHHEIDWSQRVEVGWHQQATCATCHPAAHIFETIR